VREVAAPAKAQCLYLPSIKVDGTRFLLESKGGKWWMRGRGDDVGEITQAAPTWGSEGTVLDGDLCSWQGKQIYVVYDCLMCCGNPCGQLQKHLRTELAREVVWRWGQGREWFPLKLGYECAAEAVRPRVSRGCYDLGCFCICVKPDLLWCKIGGRLPEFDLPCDGVILTHALLPATPFRNVRECVFKWKGAHTVDFQIIAGQLFSSGGDVFGSVPTDVSGVWPPTYAAGVWECVWENGQWVPVRKRDKAANTSETIEATLRAMSESLQWQEVCKSVAL